MLVTNVHVVMVVIEAMTRKNEGIRQRWLALLPLPLLHFFCALLPPRLVAHLSAPPLLLQAVLQQGGD